MDSKLIQEVLQRLENELHDREGYSTAQILNALNVKPSRENQVKLRKRLRKMMSIHLYPEYKTGGEEDVVYPAVGKGVGRYRLSIYRRK